MRRWWFVDSQRRGETHSTSTTRKVCKDIQQTSTTPVSSYLSFVPVKIFNALAIFKDA
jgi:hypothetical protein